MNDITKADQSFLGEFADWFLEQAFSDRSRVCIVFPNRRAGLYFRLRLGERISSPELLPGMYPVQDFMIAASGLRQAGELEALALLYRVYAEIEKESARSFDDFLGWAPMLLNDLNDTDQYLADAQALFGLLSDARAISQWNPDGRPLTETQKNYLRLYRSMADIHRELGKLYQEKKTGTYGHLCRVALSNPDAHFISRWDHFIFAGLNALSKAEENMADKLYQEGKAMFFWDADPYILDEKQEAGTFIRRYLKKWEERSHLAGGGRSLCTSAVKIRISGAPGNIMQVKAAAEILQKSFREKGAPHSAGDTAVIMADESLLLPLLNSVPAEAEKFNITMGFPVRYSSVYHFVTLVLDLRENSGRFSGMKKAEVPLFYHRDILRLLNHPYMQSYIWKHEGSFENGPARRVSEMLKKSNRMLYDAATLRNAFAASGFLNPDLLMPFFVTSGSDGRSVISDLSFQIYSIQEALETQSEGDAEKSILGEICRRMEEVRYQLSVEVLSQLSLKTIRNLIRQYVLGISIPFSGEPLTGLQLMGMLESRALDFRHVILLSANEGILPSSAQSNSFIPPDIRATFSLPTYREREAVFAYHFYHLLQRSETTDILYNTESDFLGGGEVTRFVRQIRHELPAINPHAEISETVISVQPPLSEAAEKISIEKSPEIMELLRDKAAKGLAPSALNRYRACPLWFALEQLLGFKEEEETEDSIDSRTFGDIVHHVMENLFRPFSGKAPAADEIRAMEDRIDTIAEEAFRLKYAGGELGFGKNLLVVKVIRAYLHSYLRHLAEEVAQLKKENTIFTIVAIEDFFYRPLILNSGMKGEEVRIKGKVDRVDRYGTSVRVIDFKTGRVDSRELKLLEWENLHEGTIADKAFQLLCYAWLMEAKLQTGMGEVCAGILSFRQMSKGLMKVEIPGGSNHITSDDLRKFEESLQHILGGIFDPVLPFTQTENEENCKWCPFRQMCGRI